MRQRDISRDAHDPHRIGFALLWNLPQSTVRHRSGFVIHDILIDLIVFSQLGEKGVRLNSNMAWLVKKVLSEEECAALISASEDTGFVSRKFRGDGHDSASCVVSSGKLAAAVFARLKDTLPPISYFDSEPSGLTLDEFDATQGALDIPYYGRRHCINSHVRVERYGELSERSDTTHC